MKQGLVIFSALALGIALIPSSLYSIKQNSEPQTQTSRSLWKTWRNSWQTKKSAKLIKRKYSKKSKKNSKSKTMSIDEALHGFGLYVDFFVEKYGLQVNAKQRTAWLDAARANLTNRALNNTVNTEIQRDVKVKFKQRVIALHKKKYWPAKHKALMVKNAKELIKGKIVEALAKRLKSDNYGKIKPYWKKAKDHFVLPELQQAITHDRITTAAKQIAARTIRPVPYDIVSLPRAQEIAHDAILYLEKQHPELKMPAKKARTVTRRPRRRVTRTHQSVVK